MLRICRLVLLGFLLAAPVIGAEQAQDFPSRPIRIVVPFPAGGSNDIIARVVAQRLGEGIGQSVIVENRGGAGGNIGAEAVANAEADGYTLLLSAPPPLTINAALYKQLKFDPAAAFAPVALIATVRSCLPCIPRSA